MKCPNCYCTVEDYTETCKHCGYIIKYICNDCSKESLDMLVPYYDQQNNNMAASFKVNRSNVEKNVDKKLNIIIILLSINMLLIVLTLALK